MLKLLSRLFFLGMLSSPVWAIDAFVISDIRVEGLSRLEAGTIYNYLPLKVGDEVDDEEARASIKALFETGFFRNVKLKQEGTTLVVEVEERPSIASIKVNGNKDIDTEQITGMLERAELQQGRILNQQRLNQVEQALTDAYFARGRYSAVVETEVDRLDSNRANVVINVKEGRVARIKEVRIIGNEAYSDKRIQKLIKLRDSRGLNPFSKRDLYSKQKLEGDIETVREFYQNNGYFDFEVTSTNVSISPNKQDISIILTLTEGELYRLGDLSIDGADFIAEEKKLELLDIDDDQVFSRKIVSDIREAIADEMANVGYGLGSVNPVPAVDAANKVVNLRFDAKPGNRIYVRRIDIVGNSVTQDEVIRRELRQFESGWFSAKDINLSQSRLKRLGYFEDVRIETIPVAGVPDQVDLRVSVRERRTGNINIGVGYSDAEGVLYQLGYSQRNFLGTGKQIDLTLDNSDVTDTYGISYTNPYYTENGVSRGFSLRSTQVDSTEASTAEYIADTLEFSLNYKVPISETNAIHFSAFAENIQLTETAETPPELEGFIDRHPDNDNFGSRLSFSKNSLDDFIFPTKGFSGRASLEASLPGSDLEYYKVNLTGATYLPLGAEMTLHSSIKIGYGNSYGDTSGESLPFYKNYYAGGPSTVRGFDSRSLGPVDSGDTPEPLGGNRRIVASMEWLLPAFGSVDTKDKRFGLFVDGGMVFGSDEDYDLGELRYSAGVLFQWYSPVGPMSLSYGVPLNEEEGDDLEKIQFMLGTLFH